MEIVQALKDSNILLKRITKTIKNEIKQQKGVFLSMLLGTLGAPLLGNLLTEKGTVRAGGGTIRAGEGINKKALIPPHLLTNFEIKEYYKNEPTFKGVYSRDNLPKTIKNGAYVINLDEYADVGTHWIALYVSMELHSENHKVIYFDSFGVEHVPKEIKGFTLFRIEADNSIMYGDFFIGFIGFMFARKSLIDFASFFSPYDFKKKRIK